MLSNEIKSADWKTEKHVPVIEVQSSVKKGEPFDVRISLGKEIAHPNTTEHHIRWISLFFKPEGSAVPYQVGNFEFTAHGESPDGPNEGPVYAQHAIIATMKTTKSGTLMAASYCNIHGLWEQSVNLTVD